MPEPTTMQAIVGQRLRDARDAAGLSQDQVGKLVEPYLGRSWSRQAVSTAERGGREFTALELTVLSEVLKQAPSWFLAPPDRDIEITTPGGRSLDTAAQFRHATAQGAPALTDYVLGRIEHDMHEILDEIAGFAGVIRSIRESIHQYEEEGEQ